ncbi:uncharacterized protein METZ01_LOCUS378865, partial [marine metagenome]
MSSLKNLLGDVVGGGSLPQKIFYVYNNDRGLGQTGCCCAWTVPAKIRNVTFELWGGAGGGAGACCCQWPVQGAGGGSYSIRTVTSAAGTTLAGNVYSICAAGNGTCCQAHCLGYTGYTSYVSGPGLPTTCAGAGCGGKTMCHALYAYNCCHGCNIIDSRTQGDLRFGHGRDGSMQTHYCHNQMWEQVAGGPKSSSSRKGKDS